MQFINIGFNNSVNASKIVAVLNYESLPTRKIVQQHKTDGMVLDCTCGRKTKSVLVTQENMLLLSMLSPLTLSLRLNNNDIENIKVSNNEAEVK